MQTALIFITCMSSYPSKMLHMPLISELTIFWWFPCFGIWICICNEFLLFLFSLDFSCAVCSPFTWVSWQIAHVCTLVQLDNYCIVFSLFWMLVYKDEKILTNLEPWTWNTKVRCVKNDIFGLLDKLYSYSFDA